MSTSGEDHALADVTNKMSNTHVNEEAVKRVRDANWTEPQKFDYAAYNAASQDRAQASASVEGDNDLPAWAANAVKYEWSEEYGDVGPAHKELEDMLFGGEHVMKKGDEFSK